MPTSSVYICELPATMLLENMDWRYNYEFSILFSIGLDILSYLVSCLWQVKDYDATLDLDLDSMEKFMLQCLAFYQVGSCMNLWMSILPRKFP